MNAILQGLLSQQARNSIQHNDVHLSLAKDLLETPSE